MFGKKDVEKGSNDSMIGCYGTRDVCCTLFFSFRFFV